MKHFTGKRTRILFFKIFYSRIVHAPDYHWSLCSPSCSLNINSGRNDDRNSILQLEVYQQSARVSKLCYRRLVGAGDDDNEHDIFCCLTYSSRMIPPVGRALEGFQPTHMLPCNINHSYYRVNKELFVGTYMLNSTLAMLRMPLFDVSAVLEIFTTAWTPPLPAPPVARPRRQYMNNIISQISIDQHLFARDMYVYVSYLPIYYSAPAVYGTFNSFLTTTWQHSINRNLPQLSLGICRTTLLRLWDRSAP